MKNLILFLILFTLIFGQYAVLAQKNTPLLTANSPKVAIKDGFEGVTRYWNHLIKSNNPITFHLTKNQAQRQVIFYTDMDSIALNVASESDYALKVIIKSDTCDVLLTTKTYSYTRTNGKKDIDTIPFTFNKNKQIIIKGSINNSPIIDFCFDLGARVVYLIGKNLDKTCKLTLDGMMEDESITGLATEKTSSNNTLQLGNLNINHLPICYIDDAGFLEDGGGLIGFNVFQNQILELDFDNKHLVIYNKLPEKINTYAPIDFKQTTGGLYIPITIFNGKKESKGWYFFDTGADNALTFDSRFAKKEGLYNLMKKIGKASIASSENRVINAVVLEVPEVKIANFKIENVPTLLADESNVEADFEDGFIGIGLQNKFNFIIDYPNSKMYLKPNQYYADSFKKRK
jgi:Aspartyl protease